MVVEVDNFESVSIPSLFFCYSHKTSFETVGVNDNVLQLVRNSLPHRFSSPYHSYTNNREF
jgi:hypothetical protein